MFDTFIWAVNNYFIEYHSTGFDVEVIATPTEQWKVMEFLHSGKGETMQSTGLGGHLGMLSV